MVSDICQKLPASISLMLQQAEAPVTETLCGDFAHDLSALNAELSGTACTC